MATKTTHVHTKDGYVTGKTVTTTYDDGCDNTDTYSVRPQGIVSEAIFGIDFKYEGTTKSRKP